MTVRLPSGQVIVLQVTPSVPKPPPQPDEVLAYAQQVMELGLLFRNFIEACATPNRDRMLRTMKLMMVIIRSDNPRAKYADEILHLLVHQMALLSEKEAHEVFYALFVNTLVCNPENSLKTTSTFNALSYCAFSDIL